MNSEVSLGVVKGKSVVGFQNTTTNSKQAL